MNALRQFGTLFFLFLLIGGMAACTSVVEETAVSPTSAPPTAVPTELPTTAPTETAAAPALQPSPTVTAVVPTVAPSPSVQPLPETEEVGFMITGQYGGVMHALDVVGDVAFVGAGPRLLAVDVSDPANPTLLGRSDVLADTVRDVVVADGIAYLAAGRSGLVAFDVTDPAAMQLTSGGPSYAGANPPSATEVLALGQFLFVVDVNRMNGATGLLRFDVSDAANPTLLETTPLQTNDSVSVTGDTLVVVGNGRLQLLDPADPATVIGQKSLAGGSYASRAAAQGDRILVAESGERHGVEIFDVTQPDAPTAVSDLAEVEIFLLDQVVANETTLFAAGTFGEFGYCGSKLTTVDVSGDTPAQLHDFDPANCTNAIDVIGSTLYVAGRSSLQIYDVADPAAPTLLAEFGHPDGFQGVDAVAVQDDVVHLLSNGGSGYKLHSLDVAGETAVSLSNLAAGERNLLDLLLSGDTLVAPIWMGGLTTFDVADPAAPRLLYQAGDDAAPLGDFYAMVLDDSVLYTPIIGDNLVGGITAVALTHPAQPTFLSTVETGQPQVMSMARSGDWLYALTQYDTNQVHVIDISDPAAMTIVSSLTLPAAASDLFFAGGRLYAACDQWNCDRLFAIDVSDAGNLAIGQTWRLPFGVQETAVDANGNVYLQTPGNDIWLLSAGDPDNVRLAGRLMLPGEFARLKLVDSKIYAATFDGGLFIIETGQ